MATKKLLLADDSVTIQKVVELVLSEEGFEIVPTSNGAEALDVLTTIKPDIVLADIEMPKMNGYQLCEKIKTNPATSSIPVILLAGAFEPIDEELSKKVGADDFIIKPFESQDLINKINSTIGSAAAAAVGAPQAAGEFAAPEMEAVELEAAEVTAEPAEMGDEDLWAMDEVDAEPVELAEEEAVEVGDEIDLPDEGPIEVVDEFAMPEEEAVEVEEEFELAEEEPVEAVGEYEIPEEEAVEVEEEFELAEEEPVEAVGEYEIPEEEAVAMEEPMGQPYTAYEEPPTPAFDTRVAPGAQMPEIQVPGALEIAEMIKSAAYDKLSDALDSLDMNSALQSAMQPAIKDTVENTLKMLAPEIIETQIRRVFEDISASLKKEIEKVIWETVPDLAESIIKKEIEKIRSEF